MNLLAYLVPFFIASVAKAHVPALLLPINGTPVASYFLGQIEVSRAVYSELEKPGDFAVFHFYVKAGAPNTLLQTFTPLCPQIPQLEEFQPTLLVVPGDLKWKKKGESDKDFIQRLEKRAVVKLVSNHKKGSRPKYYEEHGKQWLWIGAETRAPLSEGLYALVVYSSDERTGNFVLGINEQESWTPELFEYVGRVLPEIQEGSCHIDGYQR